MAVKLFWAYRDGFEVKHMVTSLFSRKGMCGAGFSSYHNVKWKRDEKGLEIKRECHNCNRWWKVG